MLPAAKQGLKRIDDRLILNGIWKGIFDALVEECEDALVFIDASIVKAHRAASGSI